MMIKNDQGVAINYEAAVKRMDSQIKEDIQSKMGNMDERSFFMEYCKRHRAKFKREFKANTPDPGC